MTGEITVAIRPGQWVEVNAGPNAGLVGQVVGINAGYLLLKIQGGRHVQVNREDVGPAKAK